MGKCDCDWIQPCGTAGCCGCGCGCGHWFGDHVTAPGHDQGYATPGTQEAPAILPSSAKFVSGDPVSVSKPQPTRLLPMDVSSQPQESIIK
jgi:hypothetical protein